MHPVIMLNCPENNKCKQLIRESEERFARSRFRSRCRLIAATIRPVIPNSRKRVSFIRIG